MFNTTDNKLIECAQLVVRQIELFTKYTRKDAGVVVKHLQLTSGAFCIFIAILCIGSVHKDPILLVVTAFLLPVAAFHKNIAKKIQEEREIQNTLSKHISEGRQSRYMIMFSIINSLALLFYASFFMTSISEILKDYQFLNEVMIKFILVAKLQFLTFSILLVGLYFLCTTSLPPGEKQKKLLERESKKLTPVPINN